MRPLARREAGDPARFADPAFTVAAIAAGIPLLVLRRTEARALQLGVAPEAVLVREGHVTEDQLYHSLARLLGLPFIADVARPAAPADPAGLQDFVVSARCGVDLVAAPQGPDLSGFIEQARSALSAGMRLGITSPRRLAEAARDLGAREIAKDAAGSVADHDPSLSARGRPGRGTLAALAMAGLLLAALPSAWPVLGQLAALAVTVLVSATIALRLAAATAAAAPGRAPRRRALRDAELPVYTVLVPLFREAGMVPQITRELLRLDYPRAKLDIKLLLEEEDRATIEAVRALDLPGCFDVVVCPPGSPRTKPRALNIGLRQAEGDLVVVFDAEDRPAPDQLRRAAERFAADRRLACLQASLVVDNGRDGWLARMFQLEYAVLFDLLLPGLATRNLPLPLGGTSNHFRRRVLEAVRGWDAWNVTEDADLGMRLARLGYRVAVLDSWTREAAPATLRVWFGQRVRWLKGWMQTALVHGAAPGQALLGYGFPQRAAVVTHTFGTAGTALGFPLGLIAGAFWALGGIPADVDSALGWVLALLGIAVPGAGAAAMIWPARLAARRRGLRLGATELLLLVPYYLLISLAAWRALVELFIRPSHWHKTEHVPERGPARPASAGRPRLT